MPKFPVKEEFSYHPTEDTSNRHPTDRMIREHGFKIHSRKGDEEPEWERRGIILKQSLVIEIIYKEKTNKSI